ncbi:polysaccharide pyruvyl transferase family protein [Zavarzinia aquatilis]|uniref:Polysaccharide pyruvyl transferase domain-containing protein n=1 Tax=Zavarzinia aquatilis TaxID=2211142 RepID=A0A317E3M9_9PROT|nr:polysaccharide pyruvyl transferase family protein [Zavarzinia aquatilis]PWR21251.1 hypothetical protein DKG74_14750 [Zavarzinia aquatilis]
MRVGPVLVLTGIFGLSFPTMDMSQKGSRGSKQPPAVGLAPGVLKGMRAALAALIAEGEVLLDLTDGSHAALLAGQGSGVAVLEQPLNHDPATGTATVDLDNLPAAVIRRVDHVVALTPWRLLANGEALLDCLGAAGGSLICRTTAAREAALVAAAEARGLAPAGRVAAGHAGVLLRLSGRPHTLAPAASRGGDVRPAIVVAGFYGRGNCGDEALFQCIYETFAADFDVIVAVDGFGAVEGYQSWYPYNKCEIRHQCDLGLFEEGRRIVGMMIGGGGLAVGFAANLVFEARARGIPTFITGVDLPGLVMPGCDPPDRAVARGRHAIDTAQMKAYLSGFDRVMVRTRHGLDICRQLGVEADFGADWAIRLKQDEAEDISASDRRALIVLREFPLHLVPYSYVREIERLIEGLRHQGWEPAFLPFCPEDGRNTVELDLAPVAPTLEHWWNPRRVKQLIGASGLVIGVGRLHPLIFAASLGVPALSLVPPLPLPSGRKSITKIDAVCADWGLKQVATVDALLAETAMTLKGVSLRKRAAAHERLDRSIETLRGIIDRYTATIPA